ncbi:MAG: arginine--tRNA ligase [Phycisphaerae bacterium]
MELRRSTIEHVIDFALQCPACAYDLRGLSVLESVRCPECGQIYDIAPLLDQNRFDQRVEEFEVASQRLVGGAWFLALSIILPLAPIVLPVGIIAIVMARRHIADLVGPMRSDPAIRRWSLAEICYPTTLGLLIVVGFVVAVGVAAIFGVSSHNQSIVAIAVIVLVVGVVAGLAARMRDLLVDARATVREHLRRSCVPDDHPILRAARRPHSLTFAMTHGLSALVSARFAAAISQAANIQLQPDDAAVRPSGDAKFGDYQCNAPMALAKKLGQKPRDLAAAIVAAAKVDDIAEPLEIAGPGFINVRLRADFVGTLLAQVGTEARRHEGTEIGNRERGTGNREDARQPSETPDRVGLPIVASPQRVVVDYSSPNIAKQMHVGHLRSTIIGDVLARVLAFDGHTVIRQNHVGDWGTQFGMLIEHYAKHPFPTGADHDEILTKIEDDYRAANERFKNDLAFADAARLAVGRLQSGDATARDVWRRVCAASAAAFTDIYRRLNVKLVEDDICGESFYNQMLAPTIELLRESLPAGAPRPSAASSTEQSPSAALDSVADGRDALETHRRTAEGRGAPREPAPGIEARSLWAADAANPNPERERAGLRAWAECRDDGGAVCVFFYKPDGEPRYKNPEGAALPLIVRKSDGAYLYASTDLAAIRYRTGAPPQALGAKRVIYVVGAPTKLHLEMVFNCVRLAGWVGDDVALEHVSFGQVLGEDRKLLRTRSGGAVKLKELLDEAERRAYETVAAKHADTEEGDSKPDEAELRRIARAVGIGAVKWFDLSRDRNADYVFNWDHMLAMQGNTAPYMMYAYTRIRSIVRKAIEKIGSPDVYASSVAILPNEPAERALAIRLARFGDAIDVVARDLTPHVLCNYLYELAGEFMRFYEACPVIAAPDDATRLSRLRLCDLTARSLRTGMGLLGIDVLERM